MDIQGTFYCPFRPAQRSAVVPESALSSENITFQKRHTETTLLFLNENTGVIALIALESVESVILHRHGWFCFFFFFLFSGL